LTCAPAPPSLRGAKRRSNPESFHGGVLDCFAALAMTEYEEAASLFGLQSGSQTQFRSLAARFARALLDRSTLIAKRARGRPGAGSHPRSAARKWCAKRPHSSIQVKPARHPDQCRKDQRVTAGATSREGNAGRSGKQHRPHRGRRKAPENQRSHAKCVRQRCRPETAYLSRNARFI
jgi:hypothetical protein